MNKKKFLVTGLAAALLLPAAAILLYGGKNPAQEIALPQPVEIVAVAKGKIDVEGGIVLLAASRDGVIREVRVEEGDKVKHDQILAVQDDRVERINLLLRQAQTRQAEAAIGPLKVKLTAAQREKKRNENLIHTEAVSRQRWDELNDQVAELRCEIAQAEAAVEVARATQMVAEHEVAEKIIKAPSDGMIVRRLARPGDGVSTLNVTPLFWFVPATPRIVRCELDENFIGAVSTGMPGEVIPENNEKKHYSGKVTRVGLVFGPKRLPTEDPQERSDVKTVECILELETGADEMLLGQRVIVRFHPAPAPVTPPARPNGTATPISRG